jgi:DNA polymerase V
VHVYSIDEAFVEIDEPGDTLSLFLIDTIKKWTGIPVTIGRAKSKTLAKLASDQAKKKHLPYLELKGDIDSILSKTPVEDIWGVGKKLTKLLRSLHIITALDLKNTPGYILKKQHSVLLEKTALELAGHACLEIEEEAPAKKSITYSRSFGINQDTFEGVYSALSFYIQKASKKLRDEESLCKQMVVFLNTSLFEDDPYTNSIFLELPSYTQDTAYLIHYGQLLLAKIFKKGKSYKKVGVILLGLIEEKYHIEDLFEIKDPRRLQATKVFDTINQKYGCDKIEYASSRLNNKFHRLAEKKSASFTTSWDDLLEVP